MVNSKTKVVFLSHARTDKEVVQAFEDHLFDKDERKKDDYEIFFSDTSILGNRIPAGANTWPEILARVNRTVFFVAFLSASFLESPWSIAELAIFQKRQRKNQRLPPAVPFLIDNDSKGIIRECGLTQGLNVFDTSADSLKQLVGSLTSYGIPCKASPDYSKFTSDVNSAIAKRDQLKKGDFFELARRHFANPRTSDNPLSFFVDRDEYEQTAINMGMAAREKLLWTVFQSPLLVADAYDYPEKLMRYDLAFESFQARRRIRLVIFPSKEEAKAYDTVDEKWHNNELRQHSISRTLTQAELTDRKTAFQASASKNGGVLLFTEASRLPNCSKMVPPPRYDGKSFLEFACSDYGEEGAPMLLMETGFSSRFSLAHGSGTANPFEPAYGHVTFYRELKAEVQKRIKEVPPYDAFYGHLGELWPIAENVFRDRPNPRVFVYSDYIQTLWK